MPHEVWPRQPAHLVLPQHEMDAWAALYGRSQRTDVAAAVIAELDADPVMKRQHLALYLGCRETLRAHKARVRRAKRMARALRSAACWLVIEPLLGLAQLAEDAGLVRLPAPKPARSPLRVTRSAQSKGRVEAVEPGTVGAERSAAAQVA